jgi:transposase
MSGCEIITRRRKWSSAEKAALLAEVEAEGGKVAIVARRHGISESVLYNWRSAKAAGAAACRSAAVEFMPLGVLTGTDGASAARLAPETPRRLPELRASDGEAGAIAIALPNGARICVDALVSEAALVRVLRAMKRSA